MAKPLKVKKISPDDPVEKAARRILRTRIKEFYSRWPDPDHTPTLEELHNLRISGKRLRYSAESLRELYPDRLALLIDVLKRSQDLLGEIQDCATQRGLIEAYITRMRRRGAQDGHIAALETIASEYERRQAELFTQFHETWRGMAMDEFRESLEAMVSRVVERRACERAGDESLPVDQTGDEARAEAIVDIDDSDVRGAGVEHSE